MHAGAYYRRVFGTGLPHPSHAADVAGDGVTTRRAGVGLSMGMPADVDEQPEGWWDAGELGAKAGTRDETYTNERYESLEMVRRGFGSRLVSAAGDKLPNTCTANCREIVACLCRIRGNRFGFSRIAPIFSDLFPSVCEQSHCRVGQQECPAR